MVLDDNLRVGTLDLRLEGFCKDNFSSREKLRPHITVRTLGNVHIESSQSRLRLQATRISLESGKDTSAGTRARSDERTLRDSA